MELAIMHMDTPVLTALKNPPSKTTQYFYFPSQLNLFIWESEYFPDHGINVSLQTSYTHPTNKARHLIYLVWLFSAHLIKSLVYGYESPPIMVSN